MLLTVSVPLLAVIVLAGIVYAHYSSELDRQLRAGAFPESANIYAAPLVLNIGDVVPLAGLRSQLNLCGYRESGKSAPATFHISGNTLDVVPPRERGLLAARILFGGKEQILRIAVDGRDAKTWVAGHPLMANLSNLSTGPEKRHFVTFRQIPSSLVQAVLSVEDKHFFEHQGIDLPRLAEAAWVDFRDQRKEQGASTLTMQLVRGLWLQPAKRWRRKIAEAMMTIHLERRWPKEEIFQTYANHVFLGKQGAYDIRGFAEAARMYFGEELRNLSVAQAALLAGMVQRPSYFNPYRHPERAKERRDLVLALMRTNGYIDQAQYAEAAAAPLRVIDQGQADELYGAPWVLDVVGSEMPRDESGGVTKNIYTTIDLNLQRAAAEAIASGMQQVDKQLAARHGNSAPRPEAALIALDPRTGEIRAMVGGRDYARSQFNRTLARRPPGSVFKPFVYAAALNTAIDGAEHVFTPASLESDEATTFWFNGKPYQPENFRHEEYGTLTLKQALARSDNIIAVKVAQETGFGSVVSMAMRAGLNSDIRATPSVALGAYAVTPLEMAGAYTAFANGGRWVKPHWQASRGAESRQAMDPRVAYLMVNMLQEVMRSGTAAGVRSRGFLLPAAGKTGTSHDGWFAGFTSQLLCVVWVGFDDYRELDLEGAKSALPIWTDFMKKAAQLGAYRNAREFAAPVGIRSANICPDSGELAGDFCTDARSEVFIAGTEPRDVCALHAMAQLNPATSARTASEP
ncbi:MAG: transglycosylase domain-containing protein [Acidobacteriota bacterium]